MIQSDKKKKTNDFKNRINLQKRSRMHELIGHFGQVHTIFILRESLSSLQFWLFPTTYHFFVIHAGRFETLRTLESRTRAAVVVVVVPVEAGSCGVVLAAGAAVAGALEALSAAGGAVTPFGFTPYGFGVPTGGDQAP